MTASLLIEIGLEELPTAAMRPLAETFADALAGALDEAGLAHGAVRALATPRRITALIANTAGEGAAEAIEKYGPTAAIAYDDAGQPTKAGEGFARSVGASMADLVVEDSDKGPRLVYRGTAPGRTLAGVIQPAVDQALRALPIAKRMRWGDSEAAFVRPVHWVVALHGSEILPVSVFGVEAGNATRGHRFHHPAAITLADADAYEARLYDPGHVVADMAERYALVEREVHAAADTLGGGALVDIALVEEVIALVEWPVGVAGRFDTRFLALPREVLIATLEGHQRYFPVEDRHTGELMAGFVTLANIVSRDPAQVVAGNERVVRPRLADALFFWEADQRGGLSARVDSLTAVSFQQALGSLADKSTRVAAIAKTLAAPAGAEPDAVARAAILAKADLVTEMVGEFPELQGTMGGYYARLAGEPETVAAALAEQYAPVGAGGPIAATPAGRALALADRVDTLAGIFAIDKRPSGDKDPFALRRAALGVLRTLIEADIRIDLSALLADAIAAQPVEAKPETHADLWQFVMERLRGYCLERGHTAAQFEAIRAMALVDVVDFDARLKAIANFERLAEAAVVCGAHKRIRNILRRNADDDTAGDVEAEVLVEPAETRLHEALVAQQADIAASADSGDYAGALTALAPLAEPLDTFFTDVMVMADDPTLRRNRLALLGAIDTLCRRVADISCLSIEASS